MFYIICIIIFFEMNNIFLIFVGFIVGTLNSIALKWTIKKMLVKKNVSIAMSSLFIRLFIICFVFFIFLDKRWQNALYMLAGFTIAKIFFIILEKIRSIKK